MPELAKQRARSVVDEIRNRLAERIQERMQARERIGMAQDGEMRGAEVLKDALALAVQHEMPELAE
eukprot:14817385-Alexandrium_andersonii.AAC.1